MSTHLKYCLIWTFPAKLDKPFSNTSTPTYRPYRIDRLLDHVGPFALRQGALFHRWYPGASKSPADFDRWGSCLNSKSFDDSNPFLKHLTVEIVERAWRQSLFRFWNSMSGRQMWAKMAQRICPWTTKARWSSDESDATCWLVVLWQSCQNEYHDTGIQQNASMMNTNENSPYILQILNPSCTLHVSRDNENQVRHEVYYFVLRRGQSSCTLLHGTFLLYMMGSTLCMILWPLLL